MSATTGTQSARDGEAGFVLDTRASPIVINTWFGATTEVLADAYFDALATLVKEALLAQKKFVLISDPGPGAALPSAKARKRIAERASPLLPQAKPVLLASIIIVENTLVRGAITAIGWVIPSLSESHVVASMPGAIALADRHLLNAGVQPPRGFSAANYTRPSLPR